ncbi:MAG: TVP38/TMEM64 family protein [Rubrobacteraceae bacterium]
MRLDNESTPEGGKTDRPSRSFFARHGRKIGALSFWLLLLGGYQIYTWRAGLSPLGAVRSLAELLSENPVGWLIFVGVYTLRPLILFPASLLTIASGFIFGAVLGTVLTVIGSNASAMVAYFVGRYFGGEVLEGEGVLHRYTNRLRENSFESVLIMRFIYLPYDLVNYAAGFLKIRPLPFILATALGSIPATLSFVLLGASVGVGALSGEADLDLRVLAASAVLLIASLILSRYFKRREKRRSTTQGGET